MGSKKNNRSLSDLKRNNVQVLKNKELEKLTGGKKKNNPKGTKWNGCGDIVPL